MISIKNFFKKESYHNLEDLQVFGIPYLTSEKEKKFSYFMTRSFGNILIHKTPNLQDFYTLFKSKGGIYKQIDQIQTYRMLNEDIFNIFGAKCLSSAPQLDPLYPAEKFDESFTDVHISIEKVRNLSCFKFFQKEKQLLFLHPLLTDQSTYEISEINKLNKFDYIFFHSITKINRCYLNYKDFCNICCL